MDGLQDTKSHPVVFNMPRKFVICMDPLSFLTVLDNPKIVYPLLQHIMALHNSLDDLGSFFFGVRVMLVFKVTKNLTLKQDMLQTAHKSMQCHTI